MNMTTNKNIDPAERNVYKITLKRRGLFINERRK